MLFEKILAKIKQALGIQSQSKMPLDDMERFIPPTFWAEPPKTGKKRPVRVDLDKEDYFIARYSCPICTMNLASYTYGRAWTDNGLSKEKRINCPACGQEIDWSRTKLPAGETGEGAGLSQEEQHQLERIKEVLQEAGDKARDGGLV